MTGNQLLRNPDIRPTDEIIAKALGGAGGAFVSFIRGLQAYNVTLMEWRYYNDGKAWLTKGEYKWTTARGTNKVKPIFWLSVWDGFFKVSFFFAESARAELLDLPLSGNTKELVKNAKPMGKTMQFMPVILDIENESQLGDAYELAQLRKVKVK